jgi:hypothetical protein
MIVAFLLCFGAAAKLEISPVLFPQLLTPSPITASTPHVDSASGPRTFVNCRFEHLSSSSGPGGAISCDDPLTLVLCLFLNCSAPNGGAICCLSDFAANFSTFTQISASSHFALFKLTDDTSLLLNSNVFFQISANSNGAFNKHGSRVDISSSTFTNFRVHSAICAFEVGRNEVSVLFCVFRSFVSGSRIGAATFWQCSQFVVTADFLNISVRGESRAAAFIAWLDGSFQMGYFVDSNFAACAVSQGRLLYCEDSNKIFIQNCCFANARDYCMNQHRAFSVNGTVFEKEHCPIRREIGEVGFRIVPASAIRARWNLRNGFLLLILGSLIVLTGQFLVKIQLRTL